MQYREAGFSKKIPQQFSDPNLQLTSGLMAVDFYYEIFFGWLGITFIIHIYPKNIPEVFS